LQGHNLKNNSPDLPRLLRRVWNYLFRVRWGEPTEGGILGEVKESGFCIY
jgi:hypothetical protein